MAFKNLLDSELLTQIKNRVAEEKRITLEVLHLLAEIESRKLFLKKGFSSLFEMCVKEFGYSEGSANRRISAMRLLRQIPEAEEKLKQDKVNLSTLTQLHAHIRREEKSREERDVSLAAKISREEKLELLSRIEGKSQQTCERELLKNSSQVVSTKERERAISENLTEIRFVASQAQMEKFQSARNLLAHKNPHLNWADLFEVLSDIVLQKRDPSHSATAKRCVKQTEGNSGATVVDRPNTQSVNKLTGETPSRYIPKYLKHEVWGRDEGKCQFVDPETGRKCHSQFALEFDHIQPFSLGGPSTADNLRLLCRAHNAFWAQELFGPFLKSTCSPSPKLS